MTASSRRLLGIIILFIVGLLLQQSALPFMEGGDEWHHYNYSQHLRQTGSLPDSAAVLLTIHIGDDT